MVKKYKIKINRDLCIGAGSCFALAIATFGLDLENKAVILDDNGDEAEVIKMAAQSCPTKAIVLEEEQSGRQVYP